MAVIDVFVSNYCNYDGANNKYAVETMFITSKDAV